MSALVEGWGPDEDQAQWLSRVLLEKAQRSLGLAIRGTERPVPCLVPGPNLWLSERRPERSEAAKRCAVCPVLAECAAVGAAAPLETWGVFGGHDYASDVEDLTELAAVGRAVVAGRAGAATRLRRDELLVRLGADPGWSAEALADAAGLSVIRVGEVLRRDGVRGRRGPRGKRHETREARTAVIRAEVAQLDGPILRQLRALERPSPGPEGDAIRGIRDGLLAQLWESDREFWTSPRLAATCGMSEPRVAKVMRRYRDHGEVESRQRQLAVTDRGELLRKQRGWAAARTARHQMEVAERADDPRVKRLRQLRSRLPAGSQNAALKAEQSELVAALWAEDPQFWTTERLAVASGHKSCKSIWTILQNAQRDLQAERALGVLPQGSSGPSRTPRRRRAA